MPWAFAMQRRVSWDGILKQPLYDGQWGSEPVTQS
jgi:hypothetical protein